MGGGAVGAGPESSSVVLPGYLDPRLLFFDAARAGQVVGVTQNGVSEGLEGGNPRPLMGADFPLVDEPLVGVEVNLRPGRQFYLIRF